MQTFLPYPSFEKSAHCLDSKRLGKQRVECKQIMLALENPNYGWQHHPATKMWRGYEQALAMYGAAVCEEWLSRGYVDNLLPFFMDHYPLFMAYKLPPWLGNEALHLSHRSNLLRKMPSHYRPLWPNDPDDLPYVWPSPTEGVKT